MTDCQKVKECGREVYTDGLCLPHLKGWTPKRAAKKRATGKPRKPASRARSSTKTTEATGQTSKPDSKVTS